MKIVDYKFRFLGPSEARDNQPQLLLFHTSCLRMRDPSNTTSAVPSRGTRDELAGASPNGGPLYDWVIIRYFRKK